MKMLKDEWKQVGRDLSEATARVEMAWGAWDDGRNDAALALIRQSRRFLTLAEQRLRVHASPTPVKVKALDRVEVDR